LSQRYPYLTRLNTVISPEEMLVDPIFDYDPQRPNVSNVHDLSDATGLFDVVTVWRAVLVSECERCHEHAECYRLR
jgi:hypothetical protein